MRILIVEDTPRHSKDAHVVADQLIGVGVDFATNLDQALALITSKVYNGVISDVFFPSEDGEEATSWGNAVTLSNALTNPELGFVTSPVQHIFITDLDHHVAEIRDFCWKTPVDIHQVDELKYHFLTSGQLIDYLQDNSPKKSWTVAFRYILLVLELLQLEDKGLSIIKEAELRGSPYGGSNLRDCLVDNSSTFPQLVLSVFEKYNV